jgi:hypothetical protein
LAPGFWYRPTLAEAVLIQIQIPVLAQGLILVVEAAAALLAAQLHHNYRFLVPLLAMVKDQAVQGSGDAQPRGLEVTLEYNGLKFNVTKTVDKIRIIQMDGLADADVRDSRDVNPSAHGETTYPSYYGGRTLTLTGRIEAHSLDKLRDIQQALRQAFNDISRERALIFRTPDPRDDIMLICKKSSPMTMLESQTDYRFFRDFLITLRASNPRFLSYLVQSSTSSFSFLDSFTSASALDGYDIFTLS